MRFLCLIAVLAVVFPSAARAQASRDVLLNVCNDTGLVAAAAAAYRTGPGDGRTLRSWFLIEPGTCLDGALNNVAGDSLDLHVMSGSFHWPGDDGRTYCVPAGSTFAVASQPPCANGSQERAFVSLPIEVRVRAGIHTGDIDLTDSGYVGLTVHAAARIMAAAHGGQTLMSGDTARRCSSPIKPRSLGDFALRGLEGSYELFQVDAPGLPKDFLPPAV